MDILAGSANDLGDTVYQSLLRFRFDVFVERLGWHLPCNSPKQRVEADQFDTPKTRYIVGIQAERVVGYARLLPTTEPYLLRDVFAWISDASLPANSCIWEVSRFAVANQAGHVGASFFRYALAQAHVWGAETVVAVTTVQLERYFRRHGIGHERMGAVHRHERDALVALRFPAGD